MGGRLLDPPVAGERQPLGPPPYSFRPADEPALSAEPHPHAADSAQHLVSVAFVALLAGEGWKSRSTKQVPYLGRVPWASAPDTPTPDQGTMMTAPTNTAVRPRPLTRDENAMAVEMTDDLLSRGWSLADLSVQLGFLARQTFASTMFRLRQGETGMLSRMKFEALERLFYSDAPAPAAAAGDGAQCSLLGQEVSVQGQHGAAADRKLSPAEVAEAVRMAEELTGPGGRFTLAALSRELGYVGNSALSTVLTRLRAGRPSLPRQRYERLLSIHRGSGVPGQAAVQLPLAQPLVDETPEVDTQHEEQSQPSIASLHAPPISVADNAVGPRVDARLPVPTDRRPLPVSSPGPLGSSPKPVDTGRRLSALEHFRLVSDALDATIRRMEEAQRIMQSAHTELESTLLRFELGREEASTPLTYPGWVLFANELRALEQRVRQVAEM